jgi:hypothetical protein
MAAGEAGRPAELETRSGGRVGRGRSGSRRVAGAGFLPRLAGATLAVTALLAVVPRPAGAIANPFVAYAGLGLAWELLIVLLVFAPVYLWRGRLRWRRLSPVVRRAVFVALGACFVAVFHLGTPDPIAGHPPAAVREAYAERCAPLGEAAAPLGLEPRDVLLDPRLPAQFGTYHVRGACNVDAQRLLEDVAFRRSLEQGAGRVYLVAEWVRTVADLYGRLLDRGCSTERWRVLEAGLLFFRFQARGPDDVRTVSRRLTDDEAKASRSRNIRYFLDEDFPQLVFGKPYQLADAAALGRQLSHKFGPHYARGWRLTILGHEPSWRQRPLSFLLDEANATVTKIEVIDTSEPPRIETRYGFPGTTLRTGRMNTGLPRLEAANGGRIRRAVFLCDNSVSCPAAESLARDLLDRGDEVAGYVLPQEFPAYTPFDRWQDTWTVRGFPGAEWLLLAVCCALVVWIRVRIDRRLRGLRCDPRRHTAPLLQDLALRLAAVLTPLAFGSLIVPLTERIVHAGRSWSAVYLVDAARAGLGLLSLAIPVAWLLVWETAYRLRPRQGWTATSVLYGCVLLPLFVVCAGLAGIQVMLTAFHGLSFVALLLAPAVFAAGRTLLVGRRLPSSPLGVRLVPLELAPRIPAAGQKARWLAQAADLGLDVPHGWLLVTSRRAFRELVATPGGRRSLARLLRPVRRELGGAALLAVRSSAPREDEPGECTAGRFATVLGVRWSGLEAAITEVLESYERAGIADDEPVAVMLQAQVGVRYAGVAVREAASRGGGIQVEGAAQDAARVTSGKGAPLAAGIGACSRRYVAGNIAARSLPARLFTDTFAILEATFPGRLAIEWCHTGRTFFVVQVRPLPTGPLAAPVSGAAATLAGLAPALRRYPYAASAVVLDSSDLAEWQYGARPAAAELLGEIYERGLHGTRLSATHRRAAACGPRPAVVELLGGWFRSGVARRPVRLRLLRPLLRLANLGLWLRRAAGVRRLEGRIAAGQARLLEQGASRADGGRATAGALAEETRLLRELILDRLVRDVFDVGLLMGAGGMGPTAAATNADPFLAGLADPAAGSALAERFPYRSLADYALDVPRFGEREGVGETELLAAFALRDRWFQGAPSGRAAGLRRLQALARDNLSVGVALLRLRSLELGRALGLDAERVLELRFADLRLLAQGEPPPRPAGPRSRVVERLPARISLEALEALAIGVVARDDDARPSWVSGGGPVSGTVVADVAEGAGSAGGVWVVEHPTVEAALRIPPSMTLVALGGNRLCHAALVLQGRGIRALFGAAKYRSVLQPGAVVELAADGAVRETAPPAAPR